MSIIPHNIMKEVQNAGLAPESDYNLVIDDVKVRKDINFNFNEIDDEHGNLTIIVDFSILDDNEWGEYRKFYYDYNEFISALIYLG